MTEPTLSAYIHATETPDVIRNHGNRWVLRFGNSVAVFVPDEHPIAWMRQTAARLNAAAADAEAAADRLASLANTNQKENH